LSGNGLLVYEGVHIKTIQQVIKSPKFKTKIPLFSYACLKAKGSVDYEILHLVCFIEFNAIFRGIFAIPGMEGI
jgi:hypothetical protein